MGEPTLQEFSASARRALVHVDASENILAAFDAKGSSFDFLEDGGIDSLDMLDVAFYIDKDLGIRLQLEQLLQDSVPMTLDNLYKSIKENPHASA